MNPRKRKADPSGHHGRQIATPFHDGSDDDVVLLAVRTRSYDNPVAEAVRQELETRSFQQAPLLSPMSDVTTPAVTKQPMSNDRVSNTPDQEMDDDDFEQAKVALAGPKKRGRKVGSGRNESRKSPTEYSTNAHTIKARTRITKMNKYERNIANAKNSDSSWVSKKLSAWKKTAAFTQLPADQQPAAVQAKRAALKQERQAKFSGTSEQAITQSLFDRFRDQLAIELNTREQLEVVQLQHAGVPAHDARFWVDEPDSDDEAEFVDHLPAAMPTIQQDTAERHFVTNPLDDIVWKTFRDDVFKALNTTNQKLIELKRAGPVFKDKAVNSRQPLIPSTNTVNPRWQTRKLAKATSPEKFFTRQEAKVIQSIWAQSKKLWVILPGPTHWWPDFRGDGSVEDTKADRWYQRSGFDLPQYPRKQYRKAANIIVSKRAPPEKWFESLVHEDHELVWKDM